MRGVLCEDKVISEERYDEAPEDGKLVIIRFIPEGGRAVAARIRVGGDGLSAPWSSSWAPSRHSHGCSNSACSCSSAESARKPDGLFPTRPSMAPRNRKPSLWSGVHEIPPGAWGTMPIVYGTHYVVPDLGAAPYTEIVGNDQYLRQLFVVGQAGLTLESLKIGETDIDSFNEVEYEVLPAGTPSTLYPRHRYRGIYRYYYETGRRAHENHRS